MKITYQGDPQVIREFHQLQKDRFKRIFEFSQEESHEGRLEIQAKQKIFRRRKETRVAGPMYEGRQELIAQMNEETSLHLEREPSNEYDPNAVAIYAAISGKSEKIGYVHAYISETIAPLMDREESVEIYMDCIRKEENGAEPHESWYDYWQGVKITLVYEDQLTVFDLLDDDRGEVYGY
ncbi:hypothetical protein J2Z48_002969 [Croceifilum oryzae]|uniref:HIRAN domain-containing protein n=1 Tax=Croceifilum oryzae TaxID=1553429 RepID=A0AAJ1WTF7_9BACL|nr:HIRAN domain-containing protein [Croceifilum oryzae]MDQ0418765.1 hypothetical protein [Croceifilum oryzae]